MPSPFPQKVALVVGASRGIGRQIALDLAKSGYAVVVAAKSTSDAYQAGTPFPPDPNSPQSTINTVTREILEAGGQATAISVDTRDVSSIQNLVAQTIKTYGHITALIYNSGAIWWAPILSTPLARFQLLQRINPEGLYATIHTCLPHFRAAHWRGRILVVSPPIYSRFIRGKTAYAMGKIGMSVLTLGLGMDFARDPAQAAGMAITSLWPAAAIESAATREMVAADPRARGELRRAGVFSDAVLAVLGAPVERVNGRLETDEDFLREYGGVVDFGGYAVVPGTAPRRMVPRVFPDLRVAEEEDEGRRMVSAGARTSKI